MDNNEHISRIVDISRFDPNKKLLHVIASGIRFIQNWRTKQRNTGLLTVIVKDKSALMSTRDTKQTKYFYDDLQGIGLLGENYYEKITWNKCDTVLIIRRFRKQSLHWL